MSYTKSTYSILIDETTDPDNPKVLAIVKNGSISSPHTVVNGLTLAQLKQYSGHDGFLAEMSKVDVRPDFGAMVASLPTATQSDDAHNPVIEEMIDLLQHLLS